jgi:hypothetical protein
MRWAEHVAGMGEERKVYRVLLGMQKERDYLEDQGIDIREIGCRFSWLGIETGGRLL